VLTIDISFLRKKVRLNIEVGIHPGSSTKSSKAIFAISKKNVLANNIPFNLNWMKIKAPSGTLWIRRRIFYYHVLRESMRQPGERKYQVDSVSEKVD
jgi:hypothetical protein